MLDRRSNSAAPIVPMVEDLESRQFLSAAGLGVNVNDGSSATMKKAIPVLKRLGVTSVRIWVGVSNFNSHAWNGTLQRAVDYGNAGFDVMVAVVPNGGKVPNAAAVKGWFQWAVGNASLKNAVDRWQIGNEPDHKNYWNGTLSQYVTNFLKPAAEALRPKGEPVVSAGPSWNAEDVRKMINAGMLNYVDYVGYHPYAKGVALQKQRISEIRAVVGGRKPIIASEWNVRGLEGNKSAWAAAVKQTMPNISANFARNYYFALVAKSGTMAGQAGIMTTGGTPTPFFNAIASAKGISVAPIAVKSIGNTPSAVVADDTTTDPTPAAPAKTAPAAPATSAAVTRVSLFNADTDRVISGYEFLAGGDTIDLSKIGTRNIAIVAQTAGETSSVKFVFNGNATIDNSAAFSAFGNSGSNYTGAGLHQGKQTLAVTPFAQDNASGAAGATLSFTFSVIGAPTTSTLGATFGAPAGLTASAVKTSAFGQTKIGAFPALDDDSRAAAQVLE
jgi:hypothetical protein